MFFRVLLYAILAVTSAQTLTVTSGASRFRSGKRLVLVTSPPKFTTSSKIQCVALCANKKASCVALNFNRVTSECELLPKRLCDDLTFQLVDDSGVYVDVDRSLDTERPNWDNQACVNEGRCSGHCPQISTAAIIETTSQETTTESTTPEPTTVEETTTIAEETTTIAEEITTIAEETTPEETTTIPTTTEELTTALETTTAEATTSVPAEQGTCKDGFYQLKVDPLDLCLRYVPAASGGAAALSDTCKNDNAKLLVFKRPDDVTGVLKWFVDHATTFGSPMFIGLRLTSEDPNTYDWADPDANPPVQFKTCAPCWPSAPTLDTAKKCLFLDPHNQYLFTFVACGDTATGGVCMIDNGQASGGAAAGGGGVPG